jgi:isochorismate hydrolase
VKPEDEVVQKYRFSAFVQGSSDLPQRLRAQGYDTVLITGTVTNVCCESSARDAMMLNFKTIMVSDANAARTDAEHNATLGTFYATFGDVMDTALLISTGSRPMARGESRRSEESGVTAGSRWPRVQPSQRWALRWGVESEQVN